MTTPLETHFSHILTIAEAEAAASGAEHLDDTPPPLVDVVFLEPEPRD